MQSGSEYMLLGATTLLTLQPRFHTCLVHSEVYFSDFVEDCRALSFVGYSIASWIPFRTQGSTISECLHLTFVCTSVSMTFHMTSCKWHWLKIFREVFAIASFILSVWQLEPTLRPIKQSRIWRCQKSNTFGNNIWLYKLVKGSYQITSEQRLNSSGERPPKHGNGGSWCKS